MICQFNHQPCKYIACPLWDEDLQKCLFQLAVFKALGREEPAPADPCRLTPTQGDILQLLARGLRNNEIAAALSISPRTIKNHMTGLLLRLHAKNRTQAVVIAAAKGLISLDKGGT